MGVAFALGFVVVAGIIVTILGLLAIAGITLLIIYLVRRNKKKKLGEKTGKGLLITSVLLLVLPAGALVMFIISVTSNKIERMGWENFRDEWKNSDYVTDTGARHDAVEAFLEAADNGDREAIKNMFTDRIQKNTNLDKQIDEFLAVYPGGLSEGDVGHWGGSSGGYDPADLYQSAEIELNGEIYHISVGACYQNSEHPDLVGIEYVYVNSEEAEAFECDSGFTIDTDKIFIRGNFQEYDEFEAVKIGVHTYAYVDADRVLTKEQMDSAVEESRTLDDLMEKIGAPEGRCERLGWAAYGISDEEYDYAVVSYDERYGNQGEIYRVSYYEEEK